MLLQPGCNRFRRPIGKQVHRPMGVVVDQNGAVHATTAQGEIINPQYAWRRGKHRRRTMHKPQNGGRAGRHSSSCTLPTSSFTAKGKTKLVKRIREAKRPLSRG